MQTLLGKDSTISHRENCSRFPYLVWDELVDAFLRVPIREITLHKCE